MMSYNPSRDDEYFYLRELESKSVTSLLERAVPSFSQPVLCRLKPKSITSLAQDAELSFPVSNLITQYSGHFVDLQRCRDRVSELKNLPADDLTWDDMIYLHKNKLGLRGVTDDDMAIHEQKKGGRGDAVTLAFFGMGKQKTFPFTTLLNETTMNEKHSQQKSELLKSLQEGIKWHIGICFAYGYSVAFELVSRPDSALIPYDFGDTYPLGKCGTADFKASQVKKIILRNDCPIWNVESIYRFIVTDIKKLRMTEEKEQECRSSPGDQKSSETKSIDEEKSSLLQQLIGYFY